MTRRIVDVDVDPDVGELVEKNELEVAAYGDMRRVFDATESTEMPRACRCVGGEDDLDVREG
jgi:hypothetical protein